MYGYMLVELMRITEEKREREGKEWQRFIAKVPLTGVRVSPRVSV